MSAQGATAARGSCTGGGTTENAPPDPDQDQAAPDDAEGAAANHVDIDAVDAVAEPENAAGGTEVAGPLFLVRCEPPEDLHTS